MILILELNLGYEQSFWLSGCWTWLPVYARGFAGVSGKIAQQMNLFNKVMTLSLHLISILEKKYSAITLLIRTGNTAAGFRYNLLSLGLLTFDREKINWILLSHRKTLCVFWVLKLNLHWSWLLQVKRVQLSSQFFFCWK